LVWYGTEYLVPRSNDNFLEGIDSLCCESLDLLKKNNFDYCLWVEKLLSYLSPWENTLDSLPGGSGSSNMSPGLIGICNFPHPESFADSLVHEISHHYFFLSQLIEPSCDGSDESLYYNPFLEIDRPIEKILFAYHAFANVFLYTHSALQTEGGDRDYLSKRYSDLSKGLFVLDSHLSKNKSLTETGEGLWLPLREAIERLNK
jgi:HEXXH motif-containing protein